MFNYFNYIIYIIYSFIVLLILYLCLQIYKKYSYIIFDIIDKEIIISDKKSEKKNKKYYSPFKSKTTKKIKKLKSQYKIKSTEKTYEDIKFVSNKPTYIYLNDINSNIFNIETINNLEKIKNYNSNDNIKKITHDYLKTKQEFYNLFVNQENGKYFINNLNEFELFHKNNTLYNSNSNILIKFYNNDETYIYIFVNQNKMIKIINDEEYDNICTMIEKNNGIFMLEDSNITNNYIIGYGSYTQSDLNLEDIKKIFFTSISNYELNKNYKILSEFKYIKIYFYICKEISQ
jgi:hypothetical protein